MGANEICRRNRPTPTRIPSGSGVSTWLLARAKVTLETVRISQTTVASSLMVIQGRKVRGSSLAQETSLLTNVISITEY